MDPAKPQACRVIWLIRAQDQLQNEIDRDRLAVADAVDLREVINQKLIGTFSTNEQPAEAIVVVERLGGYRPQINKHVLRVEVQYADHTRARVVKIGPPEELAKELEGWKICARPANDRGRAFMSLLPGLAVAGDPKQLETLVYEDAYQTLHAAEVVSLEQAVLECCQYGSPSVESILTSLDQIFAEMVDRFYSRSHSFTPAAADAQKWQDRVAKGVASWKDKGRTAGQRRQMVREEISSVCVSFLDILGFHDTVLTNPNYLPEMRCGPAHGDLHGKNVLIGLVDGEARWPAVFDYEEMSRDNYLGWDFVKLESELKIRAYQVVFDGANTSFVNDVFQFEKELAEQTERLNQLAFDKWRAETTATTPRERLLALILGLRRQAKKCLDELSKQGRLWLHEYYFLLACYGLYAGRFDNYRQRDCDAIYIGSSYAATRFQWAVNRKFASVADAELQAETALTVNDPTRRLTGPASSGVDHELAFAAKFVRSRRKEFVEQGIEMLTKLRQQRPSFASVCQELALGHLELFELTKDLACELAAHKLLYEFEKQQQGLYALDVELLCRWGRLFKDRGAASDDQASAAAAEAAPTPATGSPQEQSPAQRYYALALSYYLRAYSIQKNYYPGINVATLEFLLGGFESAKGIAKSVLETLQNGHDSDQWTLATQGEAYLLLGDIESATKCYGQAIGAKDCSSHSRDTMWKQIARILRRLPSSMDSEQLRVLFNPPISRS